MPEDYRTDPDRDRAVSVRVPPEGADEGAAVPRHVPTVRYADVAGQGAAVQAVRDVCELPLTHGAYFAALGLAPPRGVILYGPPGNGKTLLAQAVATETAAHLEIISGPEILSQWVGGSEAHLRQVFARARAHHPAVILIDELDALAGRRDGAGPPHHAQLVAQFLVLLDGLDARGQVVVLATTNRLAAIDPAIRRPGRFDAHIAVPVPDRGGRLAILHRHAPPGPRRGPAPPGPAGRPDRRLVRRRVGGALPGGGAGGHQARRGGGLLAERAKGERTSGGPEGEASWRHHATTTELRRVESCGFCGD